MADELLPVVPRASLQVAISEGMDQQLRLVQPRGPRRRQPGSPPAVTPVEVLSRRPGDVARPAVVDQVDASQSAVPAAELSQGGDVVRGVVLLQHDGPHSPGVDNQEGQEVHGAVPGVVELALLDRAGDGPADRTPFEYLEVGDLIGADNPVAPPCQRLGVPVAPEDFLGAGLEPRVKPGRPLVS